MGQWVGVTFALDIPEHRPRIDGELHLRWTPGTNAVSASSSTPPSLPAPSSHAVQEEPDETDPLLTALGRLSPAQQSQIRKAVAATSASTVRAHTLPAGKPAREVTSEPPAHPAVRIGGAGAFATEKAARDAAMMRELCKASGGSIEGAPANMCAQASH